MYVVLSEMLAVHKRVIARLAVFLPSELRICLVFAKFATLLLIIVPAGVELWMNKLQQVCLNPQLAL
jgi:hypothetical protein